VLVPASWATLDGGEGDEQRSPAALRKYWSDYLEFNKTSMSRRRRSSATSGSRASAAFEPS
jgi:hypothetical protein